MSQVDNQIALSQIKQDDMTSYGTLANDRSMQDVGRSLDAGMNLASDTGLTSGTPPFSPGPTDSIESAALVYLGFAVSVLAWLFPGSTPGNKSPGGPSTPGNTLPGDPNCPSKSDPTVYFGPNVAAHKEAPTPGVYFGPNQGN